MQHNQYAITTKCALPAAGTVCRVDYSTICYRVRHTDCPVRRRCLARTLPSVGACGQYDGQPARPSFARRFNSVRARRRRGGRLARTHRRRCASTDGGSDRLTVRSATGTYSCLGSTPGGGTLFRYVTSHHPGRLSLLPFVGR